MPQLPLESKSRDDRDFGWLNTQNTHHILHCELWNRGGFLGPFKAVANTLKRLMVVSTVVPGTKHPI